MIPPVKQAEPVCVYACVLYEKSRFVNFVLSSKRFAVCRYKRCSYFSMILVFFLYFSSNQPPNTMYLLVMVNNKKIYRGEYLVIILNAILH